MSLDPPPSVVTVRRSDSDLTILFDLFAAGQRAKRLLGVAMDSSPLRPEEYAVYSVVSSEGPLTPTEMAGHLGMPVTTALDHVHQMTERGHLRRMRNPRDGRSYVMTLTEAGRQIQRQAGRAFDKAMLPLAHHLGVDAKDVRRVLEALSTAMDETFDELMGEAGEAKAN